MAEPSTFPVDHLHEPIPYRRLSAFAVAGFALGCIYVLVLVVSCILGFWGGTPVLLPAWLHVLGIIGAICALVGMRVVRQSEGTMTGAVLAAWGWWMTLVTLIGYAAYYAALYFAVCQQADAFTERWFKKIAEAKLNAAFLDTVPPAQRQGVSPADEQLIILRFNPGGVQRPGYKGPVFAFREKDFTRFLFQAGVKDSEIIPGAVEDWDYKEPNYIVRRSYTIKTREGEMDLLVSVQGGESPTHEYEGREWMVLSGEVAIKRQEASQLARDMDPLRESAKKFVSDWWKKVEQGDLVGAYLETHPTDARPRLAREYALRTLLNGLAAGPVAVGTGPTAGYLSAAAGIDVQLARELAWPDYRTRFSNGELCKTDQVRATDELAKKSLIEGLRGMFLLRLRHATDVQFSPPMLGSSSEPWRLDDQGRLSLPLDCTAAITLRANGFSRYHGDLVVGTESGPGALEGRNKDQWRITRVDLTAATDALQRPKVDEKNPPTP